MRADSDAAPVSQPSPSKLLTQGKLLTTPSRMLKLILPVKPMASNPVEEKDDLEPLTLLVHPQQPLSYLERLIQSEIPPIQDENGKDQIPSITFRAPDPNDGSGSKRRLRNDVDHDDDQEAEYLKINGKMERTGKVGIPSSKPIPTPANTNTSSHPDVSSSTDRNTNFIRWSLSTEIGDFIRDASASPSRTFEINIQTYPHPIDIVVPSFVDRTFYLRMRLRKLSKRISTMASVKAECDHLAQQSARNIAKTGFAGLLGWWYLVYSTPWEIMERITYLVGLSTLVGGYMWFLYHNREISYRAAMQLTVSRRQAALYEQKGFKQNIWDELVEEGNRLRREIKLVSEEYDVDWDEKEEAGEDVKKALREERKKEKDDDDGEKEKKKDSD